MSPISLIAWSHLMRVHWPFTSFIGYFRRRSPLTSSRTEAPLAQCEPRLIGLSQLGSWPIHTPFDDFGRDRAADRAVRADALADGRAGGERPGRGGIGLADGGERQGAERGEPAGGEAGAAQEGAAIEAAALGWREPASVPRRA